jgi:hypothetical protein
MEQYQEYIDLVREVQERTGKTDRWGDLVLKESEASLRKFLWWFGDISTGDADTIERRDMRYRLLMHCPVSMLPVVMSFTDNGEPREWEGFIRTPFESAMRSCREGIEIDASQLNDEQVVRCTIVKMTCMKRKAV